MVIALSYPESAMMKFSNVAAVRKLSVFIAILLMHSLYSRDKLSP
jgi:hypothetical protein